MGGLNFSNGKSFDLSHIRAGVSIDSENIFLKKYDSNNNSIFDVDELNALKKDIETFTGNDNKLDETESISLFAHVMGMATDKVKELFWQKDNLVYSSISDLYETQAQETATKQICTEATKALQLYEQSKGGAITKAWNGMKEFFNTKYAGDKVYRQIAAQMSTAFLLDSVQKKGSLTKREYIENKIELFKGLLGFQELPADQKALIARAMKQLTVGEMDVLITKLKNAENEEYPQLVQDTLKDLSAKAASSPDSGAFSVTAPNSIEAILKSSEADDILKYEDIFLLEHEKTFNAEKVNEYTTKQAEVTYIAIKNNQLTVLQKNLMEPLEAYKKSANSENTKNFIEAVRKELIKAFSGDEDLINQFLSKYGIQYNEMEQFPSALIKVAEDMYNCTKQSAQAALGDKTLEEYQQELKDAYENAYGYKNIVNLAEHFQASQAAGAGYAKMGVGVIGTGMMLVSGGSLAILAAGMATSVLGASTISTVEAVTANNGELTQEDAAAIKKELLTAIALNAAGAAGGVASNTLGALLKNINKCPLFLAKTAEVGSDVMLSLLSDLAITGEVDLTGEGIAQLLNYVQGRVLQNKGLKIEVVGKNTTPEARHLDNNNPASITSRPRSLEEVKPMVSRVCQRYGYDEGDVYNWLKGLSTDLNIFKDEQSLKKYLDTVADLCNRRNPNGEVIYYKPVWNYRDNHPMVVPDMDLIREIAILKSSHEHSVQIDRLCFMVEQRKMSAFELKNTLNSFKEGYISASTIDIALSNGFNGNVTSLISPVAPDKTMKRTRKQLLKELSKSSPELKAAIKQLEKEMGNDIYRVQWERLNGINITDADRLAFIKDVKNIQFMKDTENYAINYFIKLPGYGQDGNWARAMVNITEYASGMMRRGASFDEVMSYIAKDSRSYTLESMYKSGKEIDNDKARSYGILRCEKDGYLVDGTYANYGAITPFNNGGNYDAYTARFMARFAPNELRNPFPGEIELTRLAPNEKYPIKPERYNPNNPKHVKIVDGNGVTRYYEITDAMIHPDGKYASRALEMVEARHDKLLKQFQGKKITAADMDIINESIAEIHWILAHSMPWGRGSDAIANSYVKALYQSLGIRTSEPAPNISFDLQAFCTELEDYKKIYKDLYAVPPEPKN